MASPQICRAERRTPSLVVPLFAVCQQVPYPGMDQAYPHGRLPSVVLAKQPARIEYFEQLAVVLLEALGRRGDASGDPKGLGDQRREPLDQDPRDECREHQVHLRIERPDPRPEGIVVEPGRVFEIPEEFAQALRRLAQCLVVLFEAGRDESVKFRWGKRGDILHHRIQHRIADGCVPNVVVRGFLIDGARSGVAVAVCGRNPVHNLLALARMLDCDHVGSVKKGRAGDSRRAAACSVTGVRQDAADGRDLPRTSPCDPDRERTMTPRLQPSFPKPEL